MSEAPAVDDISAAGSAERAAAIRSAIATVDAGLARAFDSDVEADIDRLLQARVGAMDAQVRAAWKACLPDDAPLALFAIGGYGRGELFPQSDIDLLVLAEPEAQAAHAEALARFVALLWDAGLPVGHAVRSPAQCTEAASDISVLTSMLEARPLVAEVGHLHALQAAISPQPGVAGRRVLRCQARRVAPAPCALRRHRRQPRAEPEGRSGRAARRADAALDGAAHRRHGRPGVAGRHRPVRRGRTGDPRTRAARAVAPALRPAPGRRQARGAPALRLPEAARAAPGPHRQRRQPRRRADDAGLLPQRRAGAAHRRAPAPALRGTDRGRGDLGSDRPRLRTAPRLPGRARSALAARRLRRVRAVRRVGLARCGARPAFADGARAGRIAVARAGLPAGRAGAARALPVAAARSASGARA